MDSRLHSVLTTGESWLPDVFCTSKFFVNHLRSTFKRFHPWRVEYTGEPITNTNNSLNIRKKLKSFCDLYNGNRSCCLMKKHKSEKILWHCPINYMYTVSCSWEFSVVYIFCVAQYYHVIKIKLFFL
jgi:hypothetical protein